MFLQTGDVGTSPDQPAPIHFNVLTEKNSLPFDVAQVAFDAKSVAATSRTFSRKMHSMREALADPSAKSEDLHASMEQILREESERDD